MSETNQFDWVQFYKELADKLLPYESKRPELIEKVRQIYAVTGIGMPTLEQDDHIDDIDPFTVFGLFNKTSMKTANRIKIIKAISQLFDIAAPVPTTFDSIPVLNNLNATFYPFRNHRPAGTMDILWRLFECALAYAKKQTEQNLHTLSEIFDRAMEIKYNGNSKITMGLYWIAPDTFLNLDSRNKWYIYESKKLPDTLVNELPTFDSKLTASVYFDITRKLRSYLESSNSELTNFQELSYDAWQFSEEVNKTKWGPAEYSPEISVDQWTELLNDKSIFNETALAIMKRFVDYGGAATCVQLAERYGETAGYYNMGSQVLARRVHEKTNCPILQNDKESNWWPVLYVGRNAKKDEKGSFVWKLRDELASALDEVDLSSIPLYAESRRTNSTYISGEEKGTALADEDVSPIRYWMYSPGEFAVKWEEFYQAGIMAIGWGEIGDLSLFASKQEMKQRMKETINPDLSYKMSALATWQFANEMKPGDIVYAKRGLRQLVGRGIVTSDYEYDPSREDGYPNIRHVNWTDHGEWEHPGQVVQKTLTDITQYTDYVRKLEALFEKEAEEEEEPEVQADYPVYSEEDFLSQVYMDKPSYDTLVGLLRTKKNIILQGAPGVGKTYTAKRLAYSMMGVKDQERVMMVQFHQSYSYEDFIEGFRPASGGSGFEIKKGSFYHFCRKAADDLENEYFFIIDEINRGNLSRIFGELFMLIENDKRGNALQLLYSDEKFYVPRNVYIIGMMNTADRSLAMLDYALRRRFAFFEMEPGFESEGFKEYRTGLNSAKFDRLIACVENLNHAITGDESLGEGFCIGHSYFCNLTEATDAALRSIVEYELSPLLREYWYDDRTKANDWIGRLKDAIK